MSESMAWKDAVDYSATQGLLAKQLYVVFSEPTNGFGPVQENLEAHLQHQAKLETDGVMFAAGPFASADEQRWDGSGMFIYRAESLDEARGLADSDPMHRCGARSYTIKKWLLNEGTLSVQLVYSDGKPRIS